MGQGQSGQAGFPGQGQPGEKKDQVWNMQELFAKVPDDIDLHPIHLHASEPFALVYASVNHFKTSGHCPTFLACAVHSKRRRRNGNHLRLHHVLEKS